MGPRDRWLPTASLLATAIIVSIGCDSPPPASPSTTDPSPPEAELSPLPADMETDDVTAATPSATASSSERAISAIASGDVNAVMAEVAFSDVACSNDTWPWPTCEPGEAVGSTTPRVPFVGCEPGFLDETQLRVVVGQIVRGRSPELVSLVTTTEQAGVAFPLGPRVAVFATRPPVGVAQRTGILAVLNESGRIISLRTGCRATPEQLAALVPVAQPPPTSAVPTVP